MNDPNENAEGTEAVVQKLDALSASVDRRFDGLSASVDRRFDDFSASVDSRFASLSDSVDARFDAVDEALVEQRQYTEFAFAQLKDEMKNGFDGVDRRFDSVENRFSRLERKLDQFIDTQSRTNELVERRLKRARRRPARNK